MSGRVLRYNTKAQLKRKKWSFGTYQNLKLLLLRGWKNKIQSEKKIIINHISDKGLYQEDIKSSQRSKIRKQKKNLIFKIGKTHEETFYQISYMDGK